MRRSSESGEHCLQIDALVRPRHRIHRNVELYEDVGKAGLDPRNRWGKDLDEVLSLVKHERNSVSGRQLDRRNARRTGSGQCTGRLHTRQDVPHLLAGSVRGENTLEWSRRVNGCSDNVHNHLPV